MMYRFFVFLLTFLFVNANVYASQSGYGTHALTSDEITKLKSHAKKRGLGENVYTSKAQAAIQDLDDDEVGWLHDFSGSLTSEDMGALTDLTEGFSKEQKKDLVRLARAKNTNDLVNILRTPNGQVAQQPQARYTHLKNQLTK